jgi:hypothetical protein
MDAAAAAGDGEAPGDGSGDDSNGEISMRMSGLQ